MPPMSFLDTQNARGIDSGFAVAVLAASWVLLTRAACEPTGVMRGRRLQVASGAAQFAVSPSETVVSYATQPQAGSKPRIKARSWDGHGRPWPARSSWVG